MRISMIWLALICIRVIRQSVLPISKGFLESWFNTFFFVSRGVDKCLKCLKALLS